MIRVYMLEVGELRRQIANGVSAAPGWDKLTGWQREKISRCVAPGAKALCMGGQLLLQYGAYEWGESTSPGQEESCGQRTDSGISWHILDLAQLSESIFAPQSLTVAYGDKGKPYIPHVPWHYNLSHSGDYAALAISDTPVGMDIQQMRPYRDALVKRFFSEDEAAAYESLVSRDIQKTLFYTLWCRKEAYGKLKGTGLTEDVLKRNMLEDVDAHLYEYGGIPGYRVCVCSGEI